MATRQSQIGIGHITQSYGLSKMVDLTVHPYTFEFQHMYNIPKPLNPFYNIVSPYDQFVWACICAMVLVVPQCLLSFITLSQPFIAKVKM